MAESRRLRTQAALIAEATRWRVLLPVGALKGISEADAYRLGREHGVRPDRAWVRLYADGTEEQGPWSPAPSVSVTEDTTARYARTAADLLRQRNAIADELERTQDANDTLALTLAEAIGALTQAGGGCSRGWIPAATIDRWRRALSEAEEARRG